MLTQIKNRINLISNDQEFITTLSWIEHTYQNNIDERIRRNTGIYYTNFELATYLVNELINFSNLTLNDLIHKKFLEPCVGIGSFVFAYLFTLEKMGANILQLKECIKNIYVSDIDINALQIFKALLRKFCLINGFNLVRSYSKNIIDGLMIKKNGLLFEYTDIKKAFGIDFLFDIIITNPPYKNLKVDKKKTSSAIEYTETKKYYEEFSKLARKKFKYSCEGVVNLYKLFVEDIVNNYSNLNANITLLIPSTILNDKSCTQLRNLLFKFNTINSINCVNENNKYINANQALCSINLKHTGYTSKFRMCNNLERDKVYTIVNYDKISNLIKSNIVLSLNVAEVNTLQSVTKHKTIKDLSFISNLRGELDLTFYKDYYSSNKTSFPLIRGRDISAYHLKEFTNEKLYVSENFLEETTKIEYIKKPRIACQQIANMCKDKRLVFSYIEPNYILGNSCNFISVENNDECIDIFYLLGLLNSSFMNWFFKIKSSNNHINNYEIDNFPVPTNNKQLIIEISKLAKESYYNPNIDNGLEIDKLVYTLFNIQENSKMLIKEPTVNDYSLINEFKNDVSLLLKMQITDSLSEDLLNSKSKVDIHRILGFNYPSSQFTEHCLKYMVEKYQKLKNNQVLNHTTFKLSNLDLDMIKCVPQGGNWKDINPEVIKKSKRLVRITKTGGRTTLYGRIDYLEPCYTITTYFNRPGNGTYVHPIHNRVLSVREAARIQSFNDSYFFTGNKTDYLKQIGNAVPPLLAYELGKQLKKYINIDYSIDLFCGAGGLTSGIKKAGIKSLIGVDFEEKACITLKVNNPEINVICGDLTLPQTKEAIYTEAKKYNIDLICGGPPCQGFSMAGFRNPEDPRNKLFKEYVEVLKHFMPKVFIMENVEGMKSMENGKLYTIIKNEFKALGYKVEGKLLMANNHGVPQKRKRLITIGVRNDLNIAPDTLFPEPLNTKITAYEAIADLETIECQENALYSIAQDRLSEYIKLLHN